MYFRYRVAGPVLRGLLLPSSTVRLTKCQMPAREYFRSIDATLACFHLEGAALSAPDRGHDGDATCCAANNFRDHDLSRPSIRCPYPTRPTLCGIGSDIFPI